MCKMIFLGTTEKLNEVPWDESNPTFYLQVPSKEEKEVIQNFTKPYVYFIGTKRGCSCDFISYSNIPDEEYKVERLALQQILREQTESGNEIEVYCCWAGDYASPLEEKIAKVYDDTANGFYIDEKEMIIYYR